MSSSPGYRAAGLALSLAAALSFAVGIIFSKRLTDGDLAVPWILGIRFGLAALVLLAIAAGLRQLALTRLQLVQILLLGGLGYGGEAGFYFLGLERGSATAVSLIFYTYPAIVACASAALGREALGFVTIAALTLSGFGIVLLVLPGGGVEVSTLGAIFSLSAAIVFSGYLIFGEAILAGVSALTGAAVTVLGAALFHLSIAVAGGMAETPGDTDSLHLLGVSACTVAAFIGLVAGLRRLGATEAGLILTIEPVAAAALAAAFLGDSLSAIQAVGGAAVLCGVALRAFTRPAGAMPEAIEEAAPV